MKGSFPCPVCEKSVPTWHDVVLGHNARSDGGDKLPTCSGSGRILDTFPAPRDQVPNESCDHGYSDFSGTRYNMVVAYQRPWRKCFRKQLVIRCWFCDICIPVGSNTEGWDIISGKIKADL